MLTKSDSPVMTHPRGTRRVSLMVAIVVAAVALPLAVAVARTPQVGSKFGPAIDAPASYEGASKCMPSAKPGIIAFQKMVLAAYPGTGAGGIGRACSGSGTSEHHEGRAWDWGVNAGVASQKAAADELIAWLLERDRYGNDNAMARRFGIMYIIWNKRIWGTWGGWDTYCRMKKGLCKDPDDGGVLHPHTDHVHFSFSWAGAKKKTTGFNPSRSMVTGAASHPEANGLWRLGANGAVLTHGVYNFGSASDRYFDKPMVAMASTTSGNGYWLLRRDGKVFGFGDARRFGRTEKSKARFVAISAHPKGRGYWLVTSGGRVSTFGRAASYGNATEETENATVIGFAPTTTGKGYWIALSSGRVMAFGDAPTLGGAAGEASDVVGFDSNPAATGYWLVTSGGRVFAFGKAGSEGGTVGEDINSEIVSIASTPSGAGYWLVGNTGRAFPFGDASRF